MGVMDAFAGGLAIDLPWAEELASFWKSVPLDLVLAGHSLFVAGLAPEFKGAWLVHYLLTFMWGFGGGSMSALLIMDPKRAPLALFAVNDLMVIWTLCWWLVNYCPGGYIEKACKQWYVMAPIKACTNILRANLIVARVNLAAELFPGNFSAALILGTISGCGGRLVADSMKFGWGALPHRAELSDPGYTSRSSFVAAAAYYVIAIWLRIVAPAAGAGLIVTTLVRARREVERAARRPFLDTSRRPFTHVQRPQAGRARRSRINARIRGRRAPPRPQVMHSVFSDVLGHPLDFTQPIADMVHAISFIPKPAALVAGAAAAVAAATHAHGGASPSKGRPRRAAAVPAPAASDFGSEDATPMGTPMGGVSRATRRSSRLATGSKAS
ncbi:MAG: hypothetical protein J3K34DRAFT_521068 [Monoraphidium minutum]|nr:MAG: hypothetical protein J3K34DRAFT_521068 [Monoraphidium minutum]